MTSGMLRQKEISKIRESTVVVRATIVHYGHVVEKKFGTGYLHDEGHVVTNAHVVAKLVPFEKDGETGWQWLQGDVFVQFSTGSEIRATLIGVDVASDLAFLKLPPNSLNSVDRVSFAEDLPGMGVDFFCVGHPNGVPFVLKHGHVSNPERSPKDFVPGVLHDLVPLVTALDSRFKFIEMDMVAAPGMSGAPLSTLDGKVFGILNSCIPGTASFGVPLSNILEFVETVKNWEGDDVFVQGAWVSNAVVLSVNALNIREMDMVLPGISGATLSIRDGKVFGSLNSCIAGASSFGEPLSNILELVKTVKNWEVVFV